MIDLTLYKEAFCQMPKEIIKAKVNLESHKVVRVVVDENVRNGVETSQESALYIEVINGQTGQRGCYYTEDLYENSLHAICTAYENTCCWEVDSCEEIAYFEKQMLKNEAAMLSENKAVDFGEDNAESDVEKLTEIAIDLLKKMKSYLEFPQENISIWGSLKAETLGQYVVDSQGLDVRSAKPIYIFDVGACVEVDGAVYGADASLVAGDYHLLELRQAAKDISLKCRAQMKPSGRLAYGEYPVILGNSVVYYLFATGWQFFSGAKYLSKATAFYGKIGEKIASECLQIMDKKMENYEGFAVFCDCEGTATTDVLVVENGIWRGFLHNQSSAQIFAEKSTGNAGRRPLLSGTIGTDILVTPKNFCVEAGNTPLEEMIAHMDNGILITESFDVFHTLDIVTGEFSIPCRGLRIEKGKEMEYLASLTMSGNFRDLLMAVEEVGKEKMMHPMIALENYGIQSCPIRLSKLYLSKN